MLLLLRVVVVAEVTMQQLACWDGRVFVLI